MLTALDHLIIAVRDLEVASGTLAALLGRAPSWRGIHPEAGTGNVLFRLDNTYLELLAPEGQGPVGNLLEAHLEASGEGLAGLAFATDDAAAWREELIGRGLHPGEPEPGFGTERSSGAVRRWQRVMLPPAETRGVLLFGIQHESPADGLPMAPVEGDSRAVVHALDHVVVRSADADAARSLYGDVLGIRLALDKSFDAWGMRLLFFRIGGLTLEIAAALPGKVGLDEAEPASGDRLWGLSYRVADVAAARSRLEQAGFDLSEVRGGRRPGTRVCTVRGEPHGVATLLLGPDPPEC